MTRLDSVVEPVFLDHASTTPLDPAVAAAMVECLLAPQTQGNASSTRHAHGRAAAALVERARGEVAELVGAMILVYMIRRRTRGQRQLSHQMTMSTSLSSTIECRPLNPALMAMTSATSRRTVDII